MPQSKQQKREKALAMQEASSKLTVSQKIAKLDKLFGKNQGATKERNKLAKKLLKEENENMVKGAASVSKKNIGKMIEEKKI